MAVLLRAGMRPPAAVYPAAMRASGDLRRRRLHLAHTRADLLAHGQHTNSQYKRPASGKTLAYTANRAGGAERFAAPAVHKSLDVDRARITPYDARLRAVDLTLLNTAEHHDAHTLDLLQTVPGIGKLLSLVLLYDLHAIDRLPRGQDVVSSCRLVQCATAAAGNRVGRAGTKIGHAPRTGAFAEAAVVFLRAHPPAQHSLARLETRHGQGHALPVRAPQLARAVYDRLKRHVVFAREQFFRREWRGAEAPSA
jgi:hypothetical protein